MFYVILAWGEGKYNLLFIIHIVRCDLWVTVRAITAHPSAQPYTPVAAGDFSNLLAAELGTVILILRKYCDKVINNYINLRCHVGELDKRG